MLVMQSSPLDHSCKTINTQRKKGANAPFFICKLYARACLKINATVCSMLRLLGVMHFHLVVLSPAL